MSGAQVQIDRPSGGVFGGGDIDEDGGEAGRSGKQSIRGARHERVEPERPVGARRRGLPLAFESAEHRSDVQAQPLRANHRSAQGLPLRVEHASGDRGAGLDQEIERGGLARLQPDEEWVEPLHADVGGPPGPPASRRRQDDGLAGFESLERIATARVTLRHLLRERRLSVQSRAHVHLDSGNSFVLGSRRDASLQAGRPLEAHLELRVRKRARDACIPIGTRKQRPRSWESEGEPAARVGDRTCGHERRAVAGHSRAKHLGACDAAPVRVVHDAPHDAPREGHEQDVLAVVGDGDLHPRHAGGALCQRRDHRPTAGERHGMEAPLFVQGHRGARRFR